MPNVIDDNQQITLKPPNAETIRKVRRLLQDIQYTDGAEKAAAENALRTMGIEAAQAIRILLDPRIQKRKRQQLHFKRFAPFYFIISNLLWLY